MIRLPRFLLLGVLLCWFAEPTPGSANDAALPGGRRSAIVQVVNNSKQAVVNIHSEKAAAPADYNDRVNGTGQRAKGMGTGIVIDPRGYIVTNHHVVEDVSMLKVRLDDGKTLSARVVAKDKETDLAIIKIEAGRPLPTLKLGTSSDLMVGETVIAIGNAYGYEHSVSVGVISALHRDVTLNKEISYKSLIQTDASINPGNSGGPLINIDGELIGVNVAIHARAQGISFAIPVDHMVQVVSEMFARRRRGEQFTGFAYKELIQTNPRLARLLTIDRVLPESWAAKAGLLPGDIILQAEDVTVASSIDLERALLDRRPGEKVRLKLRRGKEEQQVELALATNPERKTLGSDQAWEVLGVRLMAMDPSAVKDLHALSNGGLFVKEVRAGSPAARAGLLAGDILVGMHIWETLSYEHVSFILNHNDFGTFKPLKFHVVRNGQLLQGGMIVGDPTP